MNQTMPYDEIASQYLNHLVDELVLVRDKLASREQEEEKPLPSFERVEIMGRAFEIARAIHYIDKHIDQG